MGDATTMKINDKKELVKLISYITMGDGGLYINGQAKNAKFIMNMVEDNQDYVYFCKDVLENIVGCRVYNRKDYNTDGCNRKPQLRLESCSHPELTKIRERVYVDKYKSIDPHALKLLDWQSLAILYMCDGCMSIGDTKYKGGINPEYTVTLNMKRLSYGDQLLLKKAIKEKLGLEFNIQKQNKYFYLRLRSKDVDTFMQNISRWVLPSFQYKIKEDFRTVSPEVVSGGDIVWSTQKCVEASRND